ncbi:MAG: hypothetical protein IPM01_29135 [Burkholderiaceae bacterium]|nr:hypothetical protein [Burkholderiaceae bacterium]
MTFFRIAPVARYGGLALGLMTALIAQAASPPLLRAPPQNVINLGVAASREVLQDMLSIAMAVARKAPMPAPCKPSCGRCWKPA